MIQLAEERLPECKKLRSIYLDNASTTKISRNVLEEMMPFLTEEYGNAGTIHSLGRKAKEAVELSRQRVADFLNAEPSQIIFTSGGTESNNAALTGLVPYLVESNKKHIITSSIEHESVLRPIGNLCMTDGFHVTKICSDNQCRVTPADLKEVIRKDKDNIGLVSVMYVNNENGAINPVNLIGQICRENGIIFHTDCVQAAGGIDIDVRKIGCQFASISSHKVHGPKGVGALYVKDRKEGLSPLIFGGGKQEFGLRGGTENVAGIVGFGKACEYMTGAARHVESHTSKLKRLFLQRLYSKMNSQGLGEILHVNSGNIGCSGKILNISFKGIDAETLLLMLDSKGVYVSSGAACSNNESKPSHVLKEMGVPDDEARESLRVSFSIFNYDSEIKDAADCFAECVLQLHKAQG